MNKEKQIEEMAKVIEDGCANIECNEKCKYYNDEPYICYTKRCAEKILNLGYRKIDKDSVVLSREEQEKILTATEKRIKELKKQILQARKETAEKFATNLKKVIHERDYVQGYAEIGLIEEIDELLKDYEK